MSRITIGSFVRFKKPSMIPDYFRSNYNVQITCNDVFKVLGEFNDNEDYKISISPPPELNDIHRKKWLTDQWYAERFELATNVKALKSLCLTN